MRHKITVELEFDTDASRENLIEGVKASLQEFADSNELFGQCYLENNEYDDLWLAAFNVKE